MCIEEVENLELYKKVAIYRKCISLSLSNFFNVNNNYSIDGISFSGEEILDICNYAIYVYGNGKEKTSFYSKFGFSNVLKKEFLIDIMTFDRLKFIYEFRQKYGYDSYECRKFAKFMGIDIKDILHLARNYAVSYLCISQQEYDWLYHKNNPNCKIKANLTYKVLFDLLLKYDNFDDIIALMDYANVDLVLTLYNVDSYIRAYCPDKTNEEKRRIKNELTKKIRMYREFINKDKKASLEKKTKMATEKRIDEAVKMITDYLNCDIIFENINDYCQYYNISKQTFARKIAILKLHRPDIHTKYLEKQKANKLHGDTRAKEAAKVVSYYILYGVPTENGIRKFDLIDYFSMTDLKLDTVIKECIKMCGNPNNIFSKFLGAYKRAINTLSSSHRAYKFDNEIGCKKSEDGFPIKGTGRIITDSEFRTIKKVFERYNIPFSLYKVAIDRIENNVDLEDIVSNHFITVQRPNSLIRHK